MPFPIEALSFVVALLFAGVHLAGDWLQFLDTVPRSRWLSAAGGVAVAYVFIHLLPELSEAQERFREAFQGDGLLGAVEQHSYLVALLGLVIFYGLERLARNSARRQAARGRGREAEPAVFWLHLGSYGLYNLLIGYLLLHREVRGLQSLIFYSIAMGLHFLVNDRGLRQEYGEMYERYGQWILAVAALLGWGIGVLVDIPELLVSTLFAFLAGGVVLNVLKEELPEERESRFDAFLAGAAVYTVLLLVT